MHVIERRANINPNVCEMVKGFFSFAAEKAEGRSGAGAAKLMKPHHELNLNGRIGL
jgi:hypothetical protein